MPENGLPWTEEDADLSEALVIVLASSGKTARGLTHQLATNRPPGESPVALLEVGSASVLTSMQKNPLQLKHRFVGYEDMLATPKVSWIESCHARRVVLVDFGGRDGAAEKIYSKLKESTLDNITVIGVGPEVKVLTPEHQGEMMKTAEKLGMVQSMASGQLFAAMEKIGGAERFFGESEKEFEPVLEETGDEEGNVLGVRIVVGGGVKGEGGLKGGWRRICAGEIGWLRRSISLLRTDI